MSNQPAGTAAGAPAASGSGLKRTLGLREAITITAGTVIGVGLFTTGGNVVGEMGPFVVLATALAAQIEVLSGRERLVDRVAKIQRSAAEAGFVSSGEDLKPFFDEQWGED